MKLPGRAAPAETAPAETAADEKPQPDPRLRRARARVRRLTKLLDDKARQLQHQSHELETLRAWTLDVFPELPVPEELDAALTRMREEGLTFLTHDQLRSIVGCVLEVEASGREGILIEAGTARGGSAIAMALAKSVGRELRVYDVFGQIPAPGEEDGEAVAKRYETIVAGEAPGRGGEVYYGYRDDLLGEVRASFEQYGRPVDEHHVELVPGLFQDTIEGDEPVALAHIDGDWYESTMTCLERITPRLVVGGRLVIDDYFMWSGCRKAVDLYFADRPGYRVEWRAKVHVVRTA